MSSHGNECAVGRECHCGLEGTDVTVPSEVVCRRPRLQLQQHRTIGDRAFPVAAAKVWNALPPVITSLPSLWGHSSVHWRRNCWLFRRSYTATQTIGHSSIDISVIRDTQRPWSFVQDLLDEIRGWWWWWSKYRKNWNIIRVIFAKK